MRAGRSALGHDPDQPVDQAPDEGDQQDDADHDGVIGSPREVIVSMVRGDYEPVAHQQLHAETGRLAVMPGKLGRLHG